MSRSFERTESRPTDWGLVMGERITKVENERVVLSVEPRGPDVQLSVSILWTDRTPEKQAFFRAIGLTAAEADHLGEVLIHAARLARAAIPSTTPSARSASPQDGEGR